MITNDRQNHGFPRSNGLAIRRKKELSKSRLEHIWRYV